MPVTVGHVRVINPVVQDKVLAILTSKGEHYYESIFFEGDSRKLAILIKYVTKNELGIRVYGIIDVYDEIFINVREGNEIKRKKQSVITAHEFILHIYPEIHGSSSIRNVVVFLSKKEIVRLIENALNKIVRRTALLKVRFIFDPRTESKIKTLFDDIVVLKSKDLPDPRLTSIKVTGTKLYQTQEYSKGLTGEVETIGVYLHDRWFLVSKYGTILTYQSLTDDLFLDYIRKILERMLHANAVVV